MTKGKVIAFFLILLIFAGILTYYEINRFGSMTGFITSTGTEAIEDQDKLKQVMMSEIAFFLVLFVILSIILKLTYGFLERRFHTNEKDIYSQRILIPLDLHKN